MTRRTVRSLHYPVLPLTEVRSALLALAARPGLFAPDLAAPMAKILRRQADYASHPSYKDEPVRQAEAMSPGVLDLARAINARAAAPAVAPSLDPIAVANAAHAEPSPLAELHRAHRYFEAAPGAEEPDVDCEICGHCTDLASTPVSWPCPTALAAGLAQPRAASMPVPLSSEAPF